MLSRHGGVCEKIRLAVPDGPVEAFVAGIDLREDGSDQHHFDRAAHRKAFGGAMFEPGAVRTIECGNAKPAAVSCFE